MRTLIVRMAIVLAGLGLLYGGTASALTVDEILDLCQAGYTTEDILEFVETLGLDDPLDAQTLVRLKEGACDPDLATELVRLYEAPETEIEETAYEYEEPSTRLYISAGWGYPYYSYWDWWWDSYSPWWGISYTWYDPWYWPYSYYPGYRWSYWNYPWWGCHWDYSWRYSRHHHYYAHDKTSRTRDRQAYHSYTGYRKTGDYRTAVSRSAVEKSYRSRAKIAPSPTTRYRATSSPTRTKSEYRVSKRSSGTTRSAIRSGEKSSGNSRIEARRRIKTDRSSYRSTTKSRSSSGTYRSTRRSTAKSGSSSSGTSVKRRSATARQGSSSSRSTASSGSGKSSGSSGSSKSSGTSQSGGSSSGPRRR